MYGREVYRDKDYFGKLQNSVFFKNGVWIESVLELFAKQEEYYKYVQEFEEENPYQQDLPQILSLGQGERSAIRVSLENSLMGKRRAYSETFDSEYFFSQEKCQEILSDIDISARVINDFTIIASNPLVGILGYNQLTEWTNVFADRNNKYYPGIINYGTALHKKVDVNIYHPFVWYLLEKKQYDVLRLFSREGSITHNNFVQYLDHTLPKRQERAKKYYSPS